MKFERQSPEIILPDHDYPAILYRPQKPAKPLNSVADVAIFPGSFNPLHAGHRKLRKVAEQRLGMEVVYELSISNVAKTLLSPSDLQARLAQFGDSSVLITNAARFTEKIQLAPQCPFVVGFDTASRILAPEFYGNNQEQLQNALQQLNHVCPKIIVGGRLTQEEGSNHFCGAQELKIPDMCAELFDFISESEFRVDVSSSDLRGQRRSGRTSGS